MSDTRLNYVLIALAIAFVFLQCRIWFKPGGLRDMYHLKQALTQQQHQNDILRKNNEALLYQVQRLQNSKEATEARARSELGMVKKGETFYQIVK